MTSLSKEARMEDRLSDLPDSILCHILSFLPTNEAVQTVLLRRFNTLWTTLGNLDFDDDLFTHFWPAGEDINTRFLEFVHNVLTLHQRPKIDNFRVDINRMLYQDIESQQWREEIDSWLAFALRKQVKVLEFGFGLVEPDVELYHLPFSEFISDSLVELKLVHIEMKVPIQCQLGSLRVLKLVYMYLSDEAFSEIIQGCPSLKELEISNCWDLTGVSSPRLEVLKLDREFIAWEEIMKIDCPKLLSLNYTGCVDGLEILNTSSPVHFDFRLHLSITEQEFSNFTQFESVLNKLLNVKTVTLSCEFVTVMFYSIQKFVPNTLVNWKQMELSIWLTEKHTNNLFLLLNNSLCLEKLVLNVTYWHPDFLKTLESELDTYSKDNEEYSWNSLKTIIIHNASTSSYPVMVRLIETLLKSSPNLNQMVIYYTTNDRESEPPEFSMTLEQLKEFYDKVRAMAKASKTAEVLLL